MAWEPKGYEQLSSISSAKGLQSIPDGAQAAMIQAESNDVRWRDDGTSPTSSVGMVLKAAGGEAESLWYHGHLEDLEFIETASSATVNVSYYG